MLVWKSVWQFSNGWDFLKKQFTMENFMQLVKEMRQAQKAYFKSKFDDPSRREKLLQSKVLENEVDRIIENKESPKLF